MSSPDEFPISDDELFNPQEKATYETVETLPLNRVNLNDHHDSDLDTLVSLPAPATRPGTQWTQATRLTQPTQIINRSTPDSNSSPSRPTVQVTASSPIPTPVPNRRPNGILANAMAPAGTMFRRPFAPAPPPKQPITIDSDDEGPTYRGGSSDEDISTWRKNDIKTSTFERKSNPSAEKIPESPETSDLSRFKSITAGAFYNGKAESEVPQKRAADVMANAYGNAYKRSRQTGPARAMPVTQMAQPDMDLDDISDANMRQKVKRMRSCGVTTESVRTCYEALKAKKGNYDDAIEYCFQLREEQENRQQRTAIDMTGSEDELMPTPAAHKKPIPNVARQQAKAPQRSIAEKWSSTQNVKNLQPKKLEIFDPPPKKTRTLIRGRRDRSSPVPEAKISKPPEREAVLEISDGSDESDSGTHSNRDETSFSARLVTFFNTCTPNDLADTAGIKLENAKHILSFRPFKNVATIAKIEAPNLKPVKGRRKTPAIGEKIVDKVEEMLTSYEAVDYLVQKCENIAKPLTAEMKSWGINVYGGNDGELDVVSLTPNRSSHDSGIGTPISDDDHEIAARSSSKKFINQPAIMASDIQMKDYQVVGINWLYLLYRKEFSCILADDMGLGKTCQVIAFLAHLFETGEKGPHLVVVPAATLENWLKEFQQFCPSLNVEPYYSTNPTERIAMQANIDDARDDINVIVTTYTLAKGKEDHQWLRNFGFCCTIFDEGHVLKNADSQVSRKLVRIKSKFRLLLTGTPLQNNLKELISLLGFLMPSMFQDKKEELQSIFTHNVKAMDENHDALLSAQRIARARGMLTPFILRRKKYQVLKDLPKKERRVEYCDMTAEQAEIYHFWLEKAYSVRERRAKGENVNNESSNILMKLRQAAIHPFMFRRLYRDKQLPAIAKQCLKCEQWAQSNPDLIVTELLAYSDMEVHKLCDDNPPLHKFILNNDEWLASGKVQKMLELLHKFIDQGHKTLVFSQFVMVLDILELVLEREAIGYFRLDGNTKVAERQDLIDDFCEPDNNIPVFMLSTKAGGAGINLAKANKVIVFDSGFNPQDDIQAENRAHRIGQTKEVEVIRLVSRGTVEEQIYAMGLIKLKLDEQVAGEVAEDDEKDENEKEKEGRQAVEEMFFQKLEERQNQPIIKVDPQSEEHKSTDHATPIEEQSNGVVPEAEKIVDNNDKIKVETDDASKVTAEDKRTSSSTLDLPTRSQTIKKLSAAKSAASRTPSPALSQSSSTRGKTRGTRAKREK